MRTVRHLAVALFLVAICSALTFADEPGKHPAYLHALSDLRHARAHLERPSSMEQLDPEEQHAVDEIDKAIREIKNASIDDGKDLNYHPPIDQHLDRRGRYRRALELLNNAHNDVANEEDNAFARGLRNRALEHIDAAHQIVDRMVRQINHE
ncbi:MAG TPA: hypothetical protein VMG31_05180 [Verrucomicrobiae bacterium]|nr:hypothetical protein [Verrucomicrobiae bacterium]